ncbi:MULTISPECIES: bifunctional phosphatase PAP2/diacylglycerol kinase family protein [unclassified Streptomyces]|uniref:bifunctional phosphatase PAP2/diacylglycerol kinase family protein n=1 Tax=unclassified Streptomyces TaxID=2593676 RepID=UPI002251CB46|nr:MULTISPECIES: bifunctional phosphatase PAP2/diacylglycerol kinase family protein [unclassified Streptomyces]MCX4525924.1 phosphatase PAP2 family protein [Streptomyces sp. NBC_01551]MCX4543513.1 phosphatase PAP2 family protein [Streptomyces sp. NBC_01565]
MADQELTWRGAVARWDRALFDAVARRHWPGADRVLPALGRAANHGVLWGGTAAAIAVFGSARARKAALGGAASLALASATVNTVGKWSVRRPRPLLVGVPAVRQLATQPQTTSFPSGHSASAFAFATGLALRSPGWGAVVAPVAASVAFSRVYTGVHYPSDVAAGAALGAAAGFVVNRLARDAEDARVVPGDERKAAGAPALPDGAGLTVVVNSGSGTAAGAGLDVLRARLPKAELIECEGPDLAQTLASAASRSAVLGVCGGDGTVNAAATAALRAGVPLAVFPGGTLNHFALDLGLAGPADTCDAIAAGQAVHVGVGRFTPTGTPVVGLDSTSDAAPTAAPGSGGSGYFLNTFSIGAYPELLAHRLRWGPRIGGGAAALLAAWRVLRAERPVRLTLAGRPRAVWLLFAGNGTYHGTGPTPRRRDNLGEGLLDVRLVYGGGRPAPRLLAAALTGPLSRSPVHTATRLRSLRVGDIPPGTALAYDGEYARAPAALVIDQLPDALVVYRPERSD